MQPAQTEKPKMLLFHQCSFYCCANSGEQHIIGVDGFQRCITDVPGDFMDVIKQVRVVGALTVPVALVGIDAPPAEGLEATAQSSDGCEGVDEREAMWASLARRSGCCMASVTALRGSNSPASLR